MKSQRWLLFGGLVTVLVVLGGAFAAWRLTGLPLDRETQRQAYSQPVSKIIFTGMTSNDIVVRGKPAATSVSVERKLRWNGPLPVIHEVWQGDTLTVSVDCPRSTFGRQCTVDYTMDVPASVAIEAEVSSGDITLEGLAGPATLRTSSGDVRVRHFSGPSLDTRSTSGDVILDDLSATTLTAEATSGDIRATFAAAPTTVDATATSGDVTVVVPRSETTYKVRMDTTSGDATSDIGNTEGGTGSISVRATSGDVRIRLA